MRIPAEWSPHAATWLQWPKGDEKELAPVFCEIISALLLENLAVSRSSNSASCGS